MSARESDLTARARIRDAALAQFAVVGVAGATMRGVAQAAGVSLGLVQHHFGTKEGLRQACDEWVLEALGERLVDLSGTGQLGDADVLGALFEQSPLLLRYLARTSLDGSAAADRVFDSFAEVTARFLTETWPERFPAGGDAARDTAAVMVAMHTGIVVQIGQIARQFGQEPDEAIGSARVAAAVVALYEAMGEFVRSGTGATISAVVEDRRAAGEDRSEEEI